MISNVLLASQKVEDWRCLNLTCVAIDIRDECHQVSRVENRAAGQEKDGPGMGCLYSQQAGLMQKVEDTHKSEAAVSKATWNS